MVSTNIFNSKNRMSYANFAVYTRRTLAYLIDLGTYLGSVPGPYVTLLRKRAVDKMLGAHARQGRVLVSLKTRDAAIS